MGHLSSSHEWDMNGRSLFLLTPAWARGTDVSLRVLHKHLLFVDGPHGPGHGRGRGQDFQAGTSGTQGLVYAVVPQTDLTDQSDI